MLWKTNTLIRSFRCKIIYKKEGVGMDENVLMHQTIFCLFCFLLLFCLVGWLVGWLLLLLLLLLLFSDGQVKTVI